MPANYERAVKSAARRALGPMGDIMERSGVAFTMRSIGARKGRAATSSGSANPAVADGEDDDDDSEQSVKSDGEGNPADDQQEIDLAAMPLDTMSAAQLKENLAVGHWTSSVLCGNVRVKSQNKHDSC